MNDTSLCLRNIGWLVTCNEKQEVLRDIDLTINDGLIKSIGGSREDCSEEIDASEWIVFPGLITFFRPLYAINLNLLGQTMSLLGYRGFIHYFQNSLSHVSITLL